MKPEVQRFIDAVPADRKAHFLQLHELVLSLYPDADVVISYQVPTYKMKTGWVALGYWKGGVSLYTNHPSYIAEFKQKHPALKTGKASINFNAGEDLPLDDVKDVIRRAVEGLRSP